MVGDDHALAVAVSLERLGHTCDLLFTADYPTRLLSSLRISNGLPLGWRFAGSAVEGYNPHYDIVWLRRPLSPFIREGATHPDDFSVVLNQCKAFHTAFWHVVAPEAVWINTLHSSRLASQKPIQLQKARELGFQIPDTLITNSFDEANEFVSKHPHTVLKLFTPAAWSEPGLMRVAETRAITKADFPSRKTFEACPVILQEAISKRVEHRIVIMGDLSVSVEINIQGRPDVSDWRHAGSAVRSRPGDLVEEVRARCVSLVRSLGLKFATLDVIETPAGEIVFLELNEAGNFLFMEDWHPELHLLRSFVSFMLEEAGEEARAPGEGFSFKDVLASPEFAAKQGRAQEYHVEVRPEWAST